MKETQEKGSPVQLLVVLATSIPIVALLMGAKALFIGIVLSTMFQILVPVGGPTVSVALASSVALAHQTYLGLAPPTTLRGGSAGPDLIAQLTVGLAAFLSAILLRFSLALFS